MERELVESLFEPSGVVVFLVLELVESLLIGIHFVSVVLLSLRHHDVVGTHHLLDLVLVHSFHLLFALKEVLVPVVVLDLLVVNFRGQLSDLLLLSVELGLHSGFLVLLLDLNLVLEIFNVSLELVPLLFLDQDFLRGLDLVGKFLILLVRVFV